MRRSEIVAELKRIREKIGGAPVRATETAERNGALRSPAAGGASAYRAGFLEGACESASADLDSLIAALEEI